MNGSFGSVVQQCDAWVRVLQHFVSWAILHWIFTLATQFFELEDLLMEAFVLICCIFRLMYLVKRLISFVMCNYICPFHSISYFWRLYFSFCSLCIFSSTLRSLITNDCSSVIVLTKPNGSCYYQMKAKRKESIHACWIPESRSFTGYQKRAKNELLCLSKLTGNDISYLNVLFVKLGVTGGGIMELSFSENKSW